MSRADRLVSKQRSKRAAGRNNSAQVQDQLKEEQDHKDNLVQFVQSQTEPLEYEYEGTKHVIPCVTEDGDEMTYHDQYYQVTRLKNGLPIEAKRMVDYRFDINQASTSYQQDREVDNLTLEPSDAYKEMKEAHEAQHPPEEGG